MEGAQERVADTPELERVHVQDVYDRIADHFSRTRYAAWPGPEAFLKSLGTHALVADIGCGNGKYMVRAAELGLRMVGCDVCRELVRISAARGCECYACDGLRTPFRSGSVDAAISIAVVHHFSTRERRIQAIAELARVVRPGGRVLVTVWTKEQPRFASTPEQDAMVPWSYQRRPPAKHDKQAPPPAVPAPAPAPAPAPVVYKRFYHLFCRGELDALFAEVPGLTVDESGEEAGNYFVAATKTC